MKPYRGGNNSWAQEDEFPSCFYSNASYSMEAIISQSLKANMASECTISEEVIAVLSAMPSSIVIYMSVHYNCILSSRGVIIWVLAIAFASTVALIEAL